MTFSGIPEKHLKVDYLGGYYHIPLKATQPFSGHFRPSETIWSEKFARNFGVDLHIAKSRFKFPD